MNPADPGGISPGSRVSPAPIRIRGDLNLCKLQIGSVSLCVAFRGLLPFRWVFLRRGRKTPAAAAVACLPALYEHAYIIASCFSVDELTCPV